MCPARRITSPIIARGGDIQSLNLPLASFMQRQDVVLSALDHAGPPSGSFGSIPISALQRYRISGRRVIRFIATTIIWAVPESTLCRPSSSRFPRLRSAAWRPRRPVGDIEQAVVIGFGCMARAVLLSSSGTSQPFVNLQGRKFNHDELPSRRPFRILDGHRRHLVAALFVGVRRRGKGANARQTLVRSAHPAP